MIELVKEKKILYRLVVLVLVTTPLFGLLGGTPFLTFDFRELSNFLPGIYFVAITTFLFWIINISLVLLAEKVIFFKKIIPRAIVSIVAGMFLSTAIFHFSFKPMMAGLRTQAFNASVKGGRTVFSPDMGGNVVRLEIGDSMSGPIPPPPRMFKTMEPGIPGIFFPQLVRSLTINLIILTLCELVFLYFRKQKVENENARLKQSNLEARNNQLKMQLHPHFLFNSLNTLRLLLKKDADRAEDYLLKLSEMLRVSTTSAMHDMVDVEEELTLCLSYLQMQKVRFGEMLHFTIANQSLHTAEGKLPVYSLQLLAENAIKHNAFTNEEPLTIIIDYDALEKVITVKNKIQPKRTMELTTRIGLTNLEERYHLLSNESIIVNNDGEEFSVKIKILSPNQNMG
jgi:hypothetical protein